MAKRENDMSADMISIRSLLDDKSVNTLKEWAEQEGRSGQIHTGWLLRKLAQIYRANPDQLRQIGILTPLAIRRVA